MCETYRRSSNSNNTADCSFLSSITSPRSSSTAAETAHSIMENPQPVPSCSAGVAASVTSVLQGLVSKPDLYLIRAAQASTLKELKAARTQLRDFNAAAKHQLEEQITAVEAAVQHLLSIRQDLDYTYASIRGIKQQLAEHHPELHQQLLQQLSEAQD